MTANDNYLNNILLLKKQKKNYILAFTYNLGRKKCQIRAI